MARDLSFGLGKVLKELRTHLRWPQREVADRAGVQQAIVVRVEHGTCHLTMHKLHRLANAMGYDVEVKLVLRENINGETPSELGCKLTDTKR